MAERSPDDTNTALRNMDQPQTRSSRAKPPSSAEFARLVNDALNHLYDPIYLQSHPLARLMPSEYRLKGLSLGEALRRSLTDTVEALRPPDLTKDSEQSRAYRIMAMRYLDAVDASAIQSQLAVSRSQFYREQRRALQAVVSLLADTWRQASEGNSLPEESDEKLGEPINSTSEHLQRPHVSELPGALTSFVGREREMDEVRQILRTTRLLTLTGAGGCGKTRLALEVASRLAGEYRDGVCLVELTSLASHELVAQTVAFALGVREEPGQQIVETLTRYLRPRHALLLLDNCEHLLLACAQLAEGLLKYCPQVKILATSREALGVGCETRWRVPSLAVPPDGVSSAATVGAYEAAQLLTERAQATNPGFALTDVNAEAVAQICLHLDGIPLAIELAAPLLRYLLPGEIARRLDDRFELLTDGSRTALARHQTLRATIDWSHDLLSPVEKVLFRRLSVFAGGWTLEAATAVCSGNGIEKPQAIGLLGQLVDKSLVVVDQTTGESRYRYLETIRQYAWERLIEAGEEDSLRRQHRDWFVAVGDEAFAGLISSSHSTWIERLANEHDNLRAALERCIQDDPERGVRLASGIWRFWRARGYVREGREWLAGILQRVNERTPQRARALIGAGTLAYEQGDHETAKRLLDESLAMAIAVGDKNATANALHNLGGLLLIQRGDPDAIRSMFEESLRLTRETADRWGEGLSLLFLGRLAVSEGQVETGVRMVGDGVGLLRESGDIWNFASALWDRGWLSLMAGDAPGAAEQLKEMHRIAMDVGDRQLAGFASLGLAMAAQTQGNVQEARQILAQTIRLFLDSNSLGIQDALCELGHLANCERQFAIGVTLFAAGHKRWFQHGSWRIHLYREAAQSRWQASLSIARASLGEAAFELRWAEGDAMSPEQAVVYAQQVHDGWA